MRVALLLTLFCLAGCALPRPAVDMPPPITPPAETPHSVGVEPVPTSISDLQKEDAETAAPPAPSESLPPGWVPVLWAGLAVPLPPGASWDEASSAPRIPEDLLVLAAGAIRYPANGSSVEQPEGPRLLILEFSGSLEAWLDRQEQQDPHGIDRATVTRLTIAGAPALRYQPVVTGTCNAAYYLVRLDERRLLWIWVDCLGERRDDEFIRLLWPAR